MTSCIRETMIESCNVQRFQSRIYKVINLWSNIPRASTIRRGVELARCTNLQKLPQTRSNKATWGSLGPISCNLESRTRILKHRFETNFSQKMRSPMGTHISTKFGVLDLFISSGKEFKLHLLKSSHFESSMNRPK